MASTFDKIADRIFKILKGSDKVLSLFDEEGNKVFDPMKARRFFAKPDNMLVSLVEEGDRSEIKLYLSDSSDIEEEEDLITSLRHTAIQYNTQFTVKKYNKEIAPKDFAFQVMETKGREEMTNKLNESQNGYIAIFKGKKFEIFADSLYDAKKQAIDHFKPSKKDAGLLSVTLAQKDGKDVVHTPESVTEAQNPMRGSSKSSYQKWNTARLIIRHTQPVSEEKHAARTRNISKIFVETREGERFKFPVNHLAGARAMCRHVGAGGTFQDKAGQHIISLSEEFKDLQRINSHIYRHRSDLNENAFSVREAVRGRLSAIKEDLNKFMTKRGYAKRINELDNATNSEEILAETDISETLDYLRNVLMVNEENTRLSSALTRVIPLVNLKEEESPEVQGMAEKLEKAYGEGEVSYAEFVEAAKLMLDKDFTFLPKKEEGPAEFQNPMSRLSWRLGAISERLDPKIPGQMVIANILSRLKQKIDDAGEDEKIKVNKAQSEIVATFMKDIAPAINENLVEAGYNDWNNPIVEEVADEEIEEVAETEEDEKEDSTYQEATQLEEWFETFDPLTIIKESAVEDLEEEIEEIHEEDLVEAIGDASTFEEAFDKLVDIAAKEKTHLYFGGGDYRVDYAPFKVALSTIFNRNVGNEFNSAVKKRFEELVAEEHAKTKEYWSNRENTEESCGKSHKKKMKEDFTEEAWWVADKLARGITSVEEVKENFNEDEQNTILEVLEENWTTDTTEAIISKFQNVEEQEIGTGNNCQYCGEYLDDDEYECEGCGTIVGYEYPGQQHEEKSVAENFESTPDDFVDQIVDSLEGEENLTSDEVYRAVNEYLGMTDVSVGVDMDKLAQEVMNRLNITEGLSEARRTKFDPTTVEWTAWDGRKARVTRPSTEIGGIDGVDVEWEDGSVETLPRDRFAISFRPGETKYQIRQHSPWKGSKVYKYGEKDPYAEINAAGETVPYNEEIDEEFSRILELSGVKEDSAPRNTVEVEGWDVYIPANVRKGNYYDFRTIPFFVEEEWGVSSPQEAVAWVMANQDEVLAFLDRLKTNYRGTGKRIVGHPIRKNVFFDRINPNVVKQRTKYRDVKEGENSRPFNVIDLEEYDKPKNADTDLWFNNEESITKALDLYDPEREEEGSTYVLFAAPGSDKKLGVEFKGPVIKDAFQRLIQKYEDISFQENPPQFPGLRDREKHFEGEGDKGKDFKKDIKRTRPRNKKAAEIWAELGDIDADEYYK